MEDITKYVWFQEGPGVRKEQYTNSGVKLLNVANLVDGKVDLSTSDRFISKEEAYGRYKHFLVDEGDLIIASSGIQVSYFDKKMGFIQNNQLPLCMNTSTIRFKSLDKNVTNIRYFMYFLKSALFKRQLQKQITGSAQLNFGPSHLKKMKINMPSIEKQNKIVEKLDKIQKIIDLRNKQLNMLKEVVKSQFVEIFGNPIINDKNIDFMEMPAVCEIIDGDRGKNYPKAEEFFEEGYCLFLNAKNVTSNGFSFENCMYITEEKDKKLRNGKLKRGDVVLTTRGTVGNLAFYTEEIPFENVRINSGMVILRMKKDIVNEIFFIEQFKMQLDNIKNKISNGSAQPQLPIAKMNGIKVLLPDIRVQNKFAEIVKQIDKQKFEIKRSLTEMEDLYNSLMNEYFG